MPLALVAGNRDVTGRTRDLAVSHAAAFALLRQAQLDIFEQVTAKASAEALTAPLHWLEKHEAWEGQIPGSSRATVKRYFSISFTLRKPLCYRVSRSELPTIVDS